MTQRVAVIFYCLVFFINSVCALVNFYLGRLKRFRHSLIELEVRQLSQSYLPMSVTIKKFNKQFTATNNKYFLKTFN